MNKEILEFLNIIFAVLDVYVHSKLDGTKLKKFLFILVLLIHLIVFILLATKILTMS